MKRILFVAPQAKFFLSHRLRLAIDARDRGYRVAVACPSSEDSAEFALHDLEHIDLAISRRGRNPLRDIRTVIQLNRILAHFRPSVVHLITAKPILYGGPLARLRSIQTVASVTGLGFLYTQNTAANVAARKLVLRLYRLGLNRPDCCVVFQNTHDREILARAGVLDRSSDLLLPGAGVDLRDIQPRPLPAGKPLVVLPARMLRMKGVEDFVDAAKILRERGVDATFRLVGDPDIENPTSVTLEELQSWSSDGLIDWSGHQRDIGKVLAEAHVVVLPSRGGEGLPKSLVDAAAAGRAAVSTQVPGCQDAIVEGETGYLCRPCDPRDLADKLETLLANPAAIARMGANARLLAERKFDIEEVVTRHREVYAHLASSDHGRR